MADRGDNPSQHPIDIQYQDDKGAIQQLSIAARTRGNFRRTMGGCTYPPIMLLFQDSEKVAGTLFHQQKKLKLVMPCKGDQYVAKEYLRPCGEREKIKEEVRRVPYFALLPLSSPFPR